MDFGSAVRARAERLPLGGARVGPRPWFVRALFHSDRTVALAAALGVHVAFALVLIQAPEPLATSDKAAFDVVFIERVLQPESDRAGSEGSVQAAQSARRPSKAPGLVAEMVPRKPEARRVRAAAAASPIQVTTQDDRWDIPARPARAPEMSFHDNPLERPQAMAPPAPERFRMRRHRSPEAVVQGVAKLVGLWPPGYTDDPCPQISRNVELLSQAGDAASRRQLHADLEIERRYCR